MQSEESIRIQPKNISVKFDIVPTLEPQSEIWIACMLGGDEANKSYNLSFSERFTGIFDRPAMEKALQELVNRHESLRSTFRPDGTEMYIHCNQKLDYFFEDISRFETEDKQDRLRNYALQNADTPFDLTNGPLFKASIFKLDEFDHYLTLSYHHIICDGFSSGIL